MHAKGRDVLKCLCEMILHSCKTFLRTQIIRPIIIISLGLDDEEQLDEIVRDSGQFLVQCPTLGALDGQISILRDFEEDVYILLGATKDFDHFHIQRMDGDNYSY